MTHGLFRNRKIDAHRTAESLFVGLFIAIGLFALGLLLSGCGGIPKDPPAAPTPAPKRPPPALCQPIEPEPDVAGGIVQPITPEERDLTARFLQAELSSRLWGRRGWDRAAQARDHLCH